MAEPPFRASLPDHLCGLHGGSRARESGCHTDCCGAMRRREKTSPFTPLTFLLGASKLSLLSSSSSQRDSAPTCVHGNRVYEGTKNHLLLNHLSQLVLDSRVVVHCPSRLLSADLSHRDFSQANAFDRGPDDRQATHLGREHVDLVGALTHIAEQTLDSVCCADVALHRLGKLVKSQRLVFFLS